MRARSIGVAWLLLSVSPAHAQITLAPEAPAPAAKASDNPEVAAIFDADQADRATSSTGKEKRAIDWSVVGRADEARRERIKRVMLNNGLKTGKDFERASFIFQHGSSADDYLLAHVLASDAVARGDRDAVWIAAATLDRFLWATGRKQVFGTQFKPEVGSDLVMTQEPYDRALLSDSVRRSSRVISAREQEQKRVEMSSRAAH